MSDAANLDLAVAAALSWEGEAALAGRRMLGSERTVCVVSGPGLTAARIAAEELLERGRPAAVLSVGVAGGLQSDLVCGDLIVCERVLLLDSEERWAADRRLLQLTERAVRAAGLRPLPADSLTTPYVLAGPEQKAAAAATGAAIVQMEDAEWARACAAAGVPFCALRVVIDPVDEDVPSEPEAWSTRPNPLIIGRAIVRRPALAREMARLALHRRRSLRELEQALLRVIPALAEQAA